MTHRLFLRRNLHAHLCFRILFAYSEEQALEDAIYYLGEGLRKGVIDLEVFLKVRSFCKLFMVVVCLA